MCPSYRATRDERDVTRGRANTLRLAITGQLGAGRARLRRDDGNVEAVRLVQGVPARMPDRRRHGAHEDRGAGRAARAKARPVACTTGWSAICRITRPMPRACPGLPICATAFRGLRKASESGRRAFPARRSLPQWRSDVYRDPLRLAYDAARNGAGARGRAVRRHLQPLFRARKSRCRAARAGRRRAIASMRRRRSTATSGRCAAAARFSRSAWWTRRGARCERTLAALAPYVARGVPVIGLEPSCLLTLPRRVAGAHPARARAGARRARRCCWRNFSPREQKAGRLKLPLGPLPKKALLHGHCHQKAFDAMGAVESVLKLVPGLEVQTIESSCCGMAGASATTPRPSTSR